MAAATQTIRVVLGRTLATPGVLEKTTPADRNIAFNRHARGDWGDVCTADWRQNDWALRNGERLLSVYHAVSGTKFWIITEADRSATTVLLPEEY